MYGGGGYGGYGSSSYGGGMSSYGGLGGSSYGGSTYGSSYGGGSYGGGLGGYRGPENRSRLTAQNGMNAGDKQLKEGQDPNKLTNPEGKNPQQNPDKKVVQQWYKMMGGLRSILELGFAFLALTNFCITTKQLMKKLLEFSKETSISMKNYIESKIPSKAISRMVSPQNRGRTMKIIGMNTLRIFAVMVLVLGLKVRKDIRRDVQKRQEDILNELKDLKEHNIQMEDESQIEARKDQEEGVSHDANL